MSRAVSGNKNKCYSCHRNVASKKCCFISKSNGSEYYKLSYYCKVCFDKYDHSGYTIKYCILPHNCNPLCKECIKNPRETILF